MKKVFSMILMVGMVLALCSPSFAVLRQDMAAARGPVVWTDPGKSLITIQDEATGQEMTFTVKKGVDPSLEPGTRVILIYKKETNVANSVRVITPRAAR